ncbi:hypothetical protein ACSBR2_039215 [Camellia fascicularis]
MSLGFEFPKPDLQFERSQGTREFLHWGCEIGTLRKEIDRQTHPNYFHWFGPTQNPLNLSINSLEGSLPPSLFQLPNLQVIDLSKNDFSSSISMNFNLPFLEIFDIFDNSFASMVPVGICINSTQIRIIDFAVNYFYGRIPSGFGNCSSLEHL